MLNGYNAPSFVTTNLVDQIDVLTSDGVTSRYATPNKDVTQISSIIEVGNTYPNAAQGGFGKVTGPDGVLLSQVPVLGTKIIVPGVTVFTFKAYGQSTVQGSSTPNVSQTAMYLVDPDEIATYSYLSTIGQSNILLSWIDNDTTYGAQASWLQFGYAVPTGVNAGQPSGTWRSAGANTTLENIGNYSNLTSGVSAGATSVPVVDGSQYPVDQTAITICLDPGNSNEETVRVTNVSGNTLTTTPLAKNHSNGAYVFHNGFLLYAQLTLPTNLSGSANYYDISIGVLFDRLQR